MSPKEPPSPKGRPHPRQGVRRVSQRTGRWLGGRLPLSWAQQPHIQDRKWAPQPGRGLRGGRPVGTQTLPGWWVPSSFQKRPQGSPVRGLSPSSCPFLPSLGQETPPKPSLSLVQGLFTTISQCLGGIGKFGGPLPALSSQTPSDSGHCPPTIPHSLHHAACSTLSW